MTAYAAIVLLRVCSQHVLVPRLLTLRLAASSRRERDDAR